MEAGIISGMIRPVTAGEKSRRLGRWPRIKTPATSARTQVARDTAPSISSAQASRLGYRGFRRSISSLGLPDSMVFLRAWKKGDRIYTALESRGYTGSLVTLAAMYRPGRGLYPLAAIAAAGQLAVFWLERRVLL